MHQNLRVKLFSDLLNSVLVKHTESRTNFAASLQDTLTLGSLVSPPRREIGCTEMDSSDEGTASALPGGLTEMDFCRFTAPSITKLDDQIQELILEELDSVAVLISDFLNCPALDLDNARGPPPSPSDSSWNIHHDVQRRLRHISASESAESSTHDRIKDLVEAIHEIHPRLEQQLTYALERFPRDLTGRSAAKDDVLTMTIEASLVKISLVRAKALKAVYDYHSPKNSQLHMRRALSAAHAKLREGEREMEEEERKLDRELAEYRALLDMVDGGGSAGFKQIVADCARVENETEECRKDLRRLGWTGET
ncbi:hypothetical protein C8R43DRAFT_1000095 [Mycena crocata]|nr:hypothetical protein C8R43DRAFT_1000095 [Mycena crocata]